MFRILLILFTTFSFAVLAQSPNVLWQKTYGGTSFDLLYDLVACSDGNYLLTGRSDSPASGNCSESTNGISDYWVVKVDNNGTIIWQNKYGGDERDNLFSALETPDGGYLLLGQSLSAPSGDKTAPIYGGYDIWIVKIDGNGNVIWDKTYGGNNVEFINSAIETSYGYILVSDSYSGISGNKTTPNAGENDIWIIGIDFSGNILWQQNYGGSSWDFAYDIIKTIDNNLILVSSSSSTLSGNFLQNNYGARDYWILKLDMNGTLLWQKNYGGSNFDEARKVIETNDGKYIILGYSNSPISGIKNATHYGDYDIWIIKIYTNGNITWENSYGGNAYDAASNLIKLNDGYFVTGGSHSGVSGNKTEISFGDSDFWGFKIDESGGIIWQKTIGGTLSDGCNSIVKNPDGTFLLGGSSNSPISGTKTISSYGNTDFWLIKLDEEVLQITLFESNPFLLHPNPVKDYLSMEFENNKDEITISIFNILGQSLFSNKYSNLKNIEIDCSSFEEGIYNVFIKIDQKTYFEKVIKTK